MFGYVVANRDKLSEEEKEIYQACYCGLCKELKKRGPFIASLTLNYDMAFLVLVLMSAYEKKPDKNFCRCFMRSKKRCCFYGDIVSYAADMNIILSYYKLYDDWQDDGNVIKLLLSKFMKKQFEKACITHKEKAENIKKYLDELRTLEIKNNLNPDVEAKIFGLIMSEIFTPFEDKKELLGDFGEALGKFIFIMDASMDLKSDIKKKRYNPLVLIDTSIHDDMLNMLMADCVSRYEDLEITENKGLIENILFSGVWSKKRREEKKK